MPQPAQQIDLTSLIAALQSMTQTIGLNGKPLAQLLTGVAVLPAPSSYTVAALPATAATGAFAWASNGRKPSEAAGAGTGVPVFFNAATSSWYSYLSGTAVTS